MFVDIARRGMNLRALGGREQGLVAQLVDLGLPSSAGPVGGVDVLDVVTLALLDDIGNPSALDLDRCWTVGQQSRALRTVEVELLHESQMRLEDGRPVELTMFG